MSNYCKFARIGLTERAESLRISELSRQSETSVSTIKFYIREGLLFPGQATARNQAFYNEKHLERLDLIRRLKEFAGLSIETIGAVLNAAGAEPDEVRSMGAGLDATGSLPKSPRSKYRVDSLEMISRLIESKGWEISEDDTTIEDIASALEKILEGWPFELPDKMLENYADLTYEMVQMEILDDWHEGLDEDGVLKFALLGTFLFEPLILAMRRLAHRVRILNPPE